MAEYRVGSIGSVGEYWKTMLQMEKTVRPAEARITFSRYPRVILAASSLAALLYYLTALHWSILELVRVGLGLTALWGPAAAGVYLLLRHEVPDRLSRFLFSAIAAYTLTTLAYFGFSVLRVPLFFYVTELGIAGAVLSCILKNSGWRQRFRDRTVKASEHLKRVDWLLVSLIAASLLVNIRYQTVYGISSTDGDRVITLNSDQLYFAGQSYELARSVPPSQQAIQAGVPERAYHMMPHLVTMLIARFTGQTDMLRALVVYHYLVIEVLLCLAFYLVARTITRSQWGGYIGITLLYILSIPMRPMLGNAWGYFYFSLYPFPSSGLEPTVLTSPQMYSGIVVLYGILFGILLISQRTDSKQTVGWLAVSVGLMVGAMLRFRVQIFIPLIPGFLLISSYGYLKTRQKAYAIAGSLALLVAVLLYFEMQSPAYLENTTTLRIANNMLAFSPYQAWINSWPYSAQVESLLSKVIVYKPAFEWAWQGASMTLFVLLNMVGLPLLLSTILYLRTPSAHRDWRQFTWLVIWLSAASTVGGMTLTTNYDNYSVGGQMLLHTCWYLAPLIAVGAWQIYRLLQARLVWHRSTWVAVATVIVTGGLVIQIFRGPSFLQAFVVGDGLRVSSNDWAALTYLHDHTPQSSVIISNKHVEPFLALFSGVAGRAVYLEYTASTSRTLPTQFSPPVDREARIESIWKSSNPDELCRLLKPTGATDLVEYSGQPLRVVGASCLDKVWESNGPGERVTIWRIRN